MSQVGLEHLGRSRDFRNEPHKGYLVWGIDGTDHLRRQRPVGQAHVIRCIRLSKSSASVSAPEACRITATATRLPVLRSDDS